MIVLAYFSFFVVLLFLAALACVVFVPLAVFLFCRIVRDFDEMNRQTRKLAPQKVDCRRAWLRKTDVAGFI